MHPSPTPVSDALRATARRIAAPALAVLLLAPALAAQDLPRATPESVGLSSARLERITDALQAYVDEGRLPGATALVLRDGRVVHETHVGMADREAGRTMDGAALFRIASQTKALVSVGVLMLQEEGRLLIQDPVGDYLPGFDSTTVAVPGTGGGYGIVPARRPITIRDLLTHTAGVGYGYGTAADAWSAANIQGWYFADRDEPVGATVGRMAALPMAAQPGEAWVYGYATDILGAVVEQVSGLSLDAFLRSRILGPLRMDDTWFYVPVAEAGRVAAVYNLPRGGALARAPDGPGMRTQGQYVAGPRTSFSGGAGLVASAEDYARFLQMLLNGGELDGVRVVSPTTVALMTRNHVGELYPTDGMGFGLGFEVVTDAGVWGRPGSVGAYGWGGAYHSTYWVDPVEGLVVVYFTQVIPATGLDDHAKLRALVYQAVEVSRAGR